jgi:hypothetical protein
MGRVLASGANSGHTVTANALVAKRAEILFEIGEAEKRIAQLRTELVHPDAVLRMFRPNFKAEGLPVRHRRPTKSPYFAHGELTKRIFDAMRTHGTVTSLEVAAQAMPDRCVLRMPQRTFTGTSSNRRSRPLPPRNSDRTAGFAPDLPFGTLVWIDPAGWISDLFR